RRSGDSQRYFGPRPRRRWRKLAAPNLSSRAWANQYHGRLFWFLPPGLALARLSAYDRRMSYFLIVAFVAGLLMFLLCSGDKKEIGKMLFFASILAFLVALAPSTV